MLSEWGLPRHSFRDNWEGILYPPNTWEQEGGRHRTLASSMDKAAPEGDAAQMCFWLSSEYRRDLSAESNQIYTRTFSSSSMKSKNGGGGGEQALWAEGIQTSGGGR